MATKNNTERTEFRLADKAGQPWVATSYAEAINLVAHGYRLLEGDLGVSVPTGPADGATGVTAAADGPPPRSGSGSGRDAWAEYSTARGVTVTDGSSRDDIIANLDRHGVPTE